MNPARTLTLALLALPLLHCGLVPLVRERDPSAAGGAPETTGANYAPPASQPEGAPTSARPGASPGKSAAPRPSAPIPTTVTVHSDCPKTTPIFYGDKPKFGSGTRSSIGSNTTTTAGRKSDGTLTVWIIDEHENGIASARVSPSTRRVEIDRTCRNITAR